LGEYHLRVLGPIQLTAGDGTPIHSVLQQTKRSALLAFLAAGPEHGRTRSEIIDLFWQDRDEGGARHALSQAVYYLRRSLGQDAIELHADRVALNPELVEVDLFMFRRRLASGDLEDAVALVRGDLLEHFPSVPGFEQWLDSARESVRQQVLSALDRLWQSASAAGDHARAIEWAERARQIAPYDEIPVHRVLTSLIADGQIVRAREAFERFATALKRDLDLEPSAATAAILQEIEVSQAPVEMPMQRPQPASRQVPPPAAAVKSRGTLARGRRRMRIDLVAAALLALLALSLAAVTFSPYASEQRAAAASLPERVGIFPFLYRGHPELAYLGDGIPELIGTHLQALDQVTLLDPRALAKRVTVPDDLAESASGGAASHARSLGASIFIVGSVVEAGGQLQVAARMYRTDGELLATASGRASNEDQLFDLVEQLVPQLVGSLPGISDLERSAALTSRSLPALRHFFRGENHFRRGSYAEAASEFDQAVAEDSTFALAMYRSAIANLWSSDADFDRARAKVRKALECREHASPIDVELFLALEAFLNGRLPEAERLYESILLRHPEMVEAWFQLAETLFHSGGLHGRPVRASEHAWRRVIDLNPKHHAAFVHLSAIAALKGDAELVTLEREVNGDVDVPLPTPQVRALRVFSTGTQAEQDQFLALLSRHSDDAIASTAAYTARYLRNPAAGARIAAVLTDTRRAPDTRARGYLLITHFALARGQPAAARAALNQAYALAPGKAEPHRLLLGSMPAMRVDLRHSRMKQVDLPLGLALPSATSGFARFDGSVESGFELYARVLSYYRAGGEEGALISAARQLQNGSANEPLLRTLALALLAERELRDGSLDRSGKELAASLRKVERWYEHLRADYLRSLARERFILAEAAITDGRDQDARDLLAGMGENSVAALPYLAPSLIRMGEIHERNGHLQAAAEAYRTTLDLWTSAEPQFATVKAEIEARLAALRARTSLKAD